ncbi:hypothetical protein [Kitasatospora setae]|uniref:hypothetical protein n=1 Tax=Kitasatospora setae TaxID=2066 RepID=UPI0012FF13CB|nr:hypothetical protein [Kitasatospora setae]
MQRRTAAASSRPTAPARPAQSQTGAISRRGGAVAARQSSSAAKSIQTAVKYTR